MTFDFIIFGSGISAKITSIALANKDFSVCIIADRDSSENKVQSNLVTFLSYGSISYLQTMIPNRNVFDSFEGVRSIHCQLDSTKGNKNQNITFDSKNDEILGKIIKNSYLEKYLNEEIDQHKNIHFIGKDKLKSIKTLGQGIQCEIHKQNSINAKLFILSSSYYQKLIKNLNIDFIHQDFEQNALSISIKANIKNENFAFQKFTREGPIALLPYSKNEASVVWSLKKRSSILKKDTKELEAELNFHLQKYIAELEIIDLEKHSLKFSFAKKLYSNNIVLLGNIAHNIHPIAGQGLNLNIKDIALFVKTVFEYASIGYDIDNQSVLQKFDENRKLDNVVYSFGILTLEHLLTSNNKFINFAARKGVKIFEKNNVLKNLVIKSAVGKFFFKSI